jgi:hypothetical protein
MITAKEASLMKRSRWLVLALLLTPVAACSGPDNPKLKEEPVPKTVENPKPPEIPGKRKFDALDKYNKAMESTNKTY